MWKSNAIKQVAVLGAGVMGAQIAAHLVNSGVETLLFDLESLDGSHNAIADKAIVQLTKLKPAPLATTDYTAFLHARNYADNLPDLLNCDLIIEAIGERLDWKESLYQRIAPYVHDHAILVTNTSGLSIAALSAVLPESLRDRFCGVHFFNPPRYMHLAELIPAEKTHPDLLNDLETWLTSTLGKGVVRAKDTPNFIANRIGVFSFLATLYHAEHYAIPFDIVDALTGALIGRPKSATFRTMDVVGLDTMQHVIHTMQAQLSNDPWHAMFALPEWLLSLIQAGHLGQKTGQGIYRKRGKTIEVYDIKSADYRVADGEIDPDVKAIFQEKDAHLRMQRLLASDKPQAQFLAACFRDFFHYCAFHLQSIAYTTRDVDLAMRWGYGWQQGPFEQWQAIGVAPMRDWIIQAIAEGHSLSSAHLPLCFQTITAFYTDAGSFAPATSDYQPISTLPVYERQYYPEAAIHQKPSVQKNLINHSEVSLSYLKEDVLVLSLHSKAQTISQSVLDGLHQALDYAESNACGLIVYQTNAINFSAGADLKAASRLIQANQWDALDKMIAAFQVICMRFKYSSVPVVAALRGRALGGGCELMMHCARVVAAFESYPGLVEVGVGLIPAAGGCKEMALRAAQLTQGVDRMALIAPYFEQIAMATVSSSAPDALKRGYLRASDSWIMHTEEVLLAALATVNALCASNYRAPLRSTFAVAGIEGHARLQAGLINWLEGGFMSPYDYEITNQLAKVLCGGDVNQGTLVTEAWMLALEKETFIALARNPLTQARIQHLLDTGKPLRN